MESHFSVRYRVNRRRIRDPLLGKIRAYGISGRNGAGEYWHFRKAFGDRIFAAKIAFLLNKNQVSLLHADDVIADLLLGGALLP